MTFSNRISLAGAIPLLVVAALAVLTAFVLTTTPGQSVNASATADACNKLSPVLWDMLKRHYDGLDDFECNTFDPGAATPTHSVDSEANATVWDFSGQELTSFAISDDDEATLDKLFAADTTGETDNDITATEVRYFDLTNNPLTVDDIDFKHIPNDVSVILSAESTVTGFQATDYTVTEGKAGYVSVAFPGLRAAAANPMEAVITVGGDAGDDINVAALAGLSAGDDKIRLVSFGTGDDADDDTKQFIFNSDADDVIFYLPITVAKDNENDEDWDIRLTIAESVAAASGDLGITNAKAEFDLANDETDVTILDADAPTLSVCDRSEDVSEAILAYAYPDTDGELGRQAGVLGFGGNQRCDDITLRDLSTVGSLTISDSDEDGEPLEALVSGDLEGLTGLTSLKIVGAGALPSGIFAGVGKDGDDTVHIYFAQNVPPADSDDPKVGKFKPSTIPSHIWADQEPQHVIVLDDDLNADKKGVTSGFDAAVYAGEEGKHIYVLTSAQTAAYILGNKVVFSGAGATAPSLVTIADSDTDNDDGRGTDTSPKVVRFAIKVDDGMNDDKGDRNTWLFLFADDGTNAADPRVISPDLTNASQLKDVATLVITDAS